MSFLAWRGKTILMNFATRQSAVADRAGWSGRAPGLLSKRPDVAQHPAFPHSGKGLVGVTFGKQNGEVQSAEAEQLWAAILEG